MSYQKLFNRIPVGYHVSKGTDRYYYLIWAFEVIVERDK